MSMVDSLARTLSERTGYEWVVQRFREKRYDGRGGTRFRYGLMVVKPDHGSQECWSFYNGDYMSVGALKATLAMILDLHNFGVFKP